MNRSFLAAFAVVGLLATASSAFSQVLVLPGTEGTAPLTEGTGVGPDSAITGYSVDGRGGEGGFGGGAVTNGTSDGAGTLTGGNPGGYADRR